MQERQATLSECGARVLCAVTGCDLRSLPLSPLEAYVYSRIDGTMTEGDLVLSTGMDPTTVVNALDRLAAFGAIRFEGVVAGGAKSQTLPRVREEPKRVPSQFHGTNPRRSGVIAKTAHDAATVRPPRGATPIPSTYRPPSISPDDFHQVKRYLDAARAALAEGNPTAAGNFYRLAQELAPHDPAIRVAVDECSAMSADTRALNERASILVLRGDAAARERQWNDAARAYQDAASLRSKDAAVLYKAAGSLFQTGDFRRAVEFAERAIAAAPESVDTWVLLGNIHLASRATVQAHRALAEAQRLSPDDPRVARLAERLTH